MKWITLESTEYRETLGMEVPGGVLVRVREWDENGELPDSHTMCLVPNCKINEGGCSERPTLYAPSPGRRGPL